MHEPVFDERLAQLLAKDPRYHREAYLFLREALEHTQKTIVRENRGQLRHVTGQELLRGIREYAINQFGPMAIAVFEEWGIRDCPDFGDIVFNMVEAGLLAKTETDSRADFEGVYTFDEAFRRPFLPAAKLERHKKPVV